MKVEDTKTSLGFNNPNESVYIFKGNTYQYLDWFKGSGAKYSPKIGWHIADLDKLPTPLPYGIEPVVLPWSAITVNDILLSTPQIKVIIGNLTHDATQSEYVGTIGNRYDFCLELIKSTQIEGMYGSSHLYLFQDDNKNEFVWITSAKILTEGSIYSLAGTVKNHQTFNNSKQTVLTRCRIKAEL